MNDIPDQNKTYKFGDSYITGQDVIYETEFFFALFDKYPVTPGHTLIVSKRKFLNLIDIQSNEWMDLYTLIKVILARIKTYDLEKFYINKINTIQDNTAKKFMLECLNYLRFDKDIQGFNIGMNDGESAGRKVYHFHMHIIPRYKNDLKKYGGGIRMVVPSKSDFITGN
ncbi:HIT family protein [Candidatus Dojkabacteria bacterium]|nr:HIT family protein [Candidatus Dojkabacteria bacterium]